MKRPCIEPGCPAYTERTRCVEHERQRDRRRGSRQQRGYDRTHDAARRSLAADLPAECGYGCGTVLHPDDTWVAAHVVDGDPTAGWMVSCVRCNQRASRRPA